MSSRSDRRTVLGVVVSLQALAFLMAALVLSAGVGFAVLRWLEGTS